MPLPSNHVLLNYDIFNVFIYKTLLGRRKKEEEDGVNLNYNIGRNARPAGCWHVPRISRRVNLEWSFTIYKPVGGRAMKVCVPRMAIS